MRAEEVNRKETCASEDASDRSDMDARECETSSRVVMRHQTGVADPGLASSPDERDEAWTLQQAAIGNHAAAEQLLIRYKPLVRARARTYRLAGADHEDLVQEGMIGLFKAIRDYRADTGSPFAAFADLCVTRQIQTAVKAAARKKHLPLNTYLSLDRDQQEGEEPPVFSDLRGSELREPERHLIHREEARQLVTAMDAGLSPFERQVIQLYVSGENYQAIAQRMQRTPKSIDNALQRIRRKLAARLLDT